MFWRAVCIAGLVLLPGIGAADTVYKCSDGKAVTFHSGGRTLTLLLADGHLAVSD